MSGLTIPDAIAFGSLCAAFLAAVAGMLNSERAGRATPPKVPSTCADDCRDALIGLTEAVESLAEAIHVMNAEEETQAHRADVLRGLLLWLGDRSSEDPSAR